MAIGGRYVDMGASIPKESLHSPILEQLEPRLLLSTSITISKPGADVFQIDDDASYIASFEENGALRIGDSIDIFTETSPVYRFAVPRLGSLMKITIAASGWEDNASIGTTGTEVEVRTSADNWSSIGTFTYGSEFTETTTDTELWLSGDIDAGVVDLLDFRFVNVGFDDLRLDNVDVTLEYAGIDAFHLESFQEIYSLYQDADDYYRNFGQHIDVVDYVTQIVGGVLQQTAMEALETGASALITAGAYNLLGTSFPAYLAKAADMAKFSQSQVGAMNDLLEAKAWFDDTVNLERFPVGGMGGGNATAAMNGISQYSLDSSQALLSLATTWFSACADGTIGTEDYLPIQNAIVSAQTQLALFDTHLSDYTSKLNSYDQGLFSPVSYGTKEYLISLISAMTQSELNLSGDIINSDDPTWAALTDTYLEDLSGRVDDPDPTPWRTYIVNSLTDTVAADGAITLREAIEAANTNVAVGDAPGGSAIETDIITFHPSLGGGTITLGGSQLSITDDLEISGLGAAQLAVDANDQSCVFNVGNNVSVLFDSLTITGGNSVSSGGGICGGFSSTIVVRNSTISGNSAAGAGGGIFGGSSGTVGVTNSIISNNLASKPGYTVFGGGIWGQSIIITDSTISGNRAYGRGGGVCGGNVTITGSTISRNWASSWAGGIYGSDGTLIVMNSTVDNNDAFSSKGGGISKIRGTMKVVNSAITNNRAASYGGGLYGASAIIKVTNSTISGNSANRGGGIGSYLSGTIVATNSTIRGNSAAEMGGGIHNYDSGNIKLVTLQNTLVASNTAPFAEDVNGILSSGSSHNFIGTEDGDPMLTAVTNGAGTVLYYLPQPGSPLIDAGDNTLAVDPDGVPLTTDQLGNPRVRGLSVDIGAIEWENQAPTDISLSNTSIRENAPNGTLIGSLGGTDPDGDELAFTLIDNAGGRFAIINDDELVVANGSLLDYESDTSHDITVEVSDGALTYSEVLTISVKMEVVAQPLSYFQDFAAGIPGAGEGWEYYSSGEGRIEVADGQLRLDDSIDGGEYSLNEAILHLDLYGAIGLVLEFDCDESGDEVHRDGLAVGDTFTDPHRNADLVAISDDGGATWSVIYLLDVDEHVVVDLDAAIADAGMTYGPDFLVKFQQYDNYAWPTDGWAFDNIEVYSDVAEVVARHVFYNNSDWDGNDPAAGPADDAAIAGDKQALMPDETAGGANCTAYSKGLNAIMIDIVGLKNPAGLTTADFALKVGNDDDPDAWDPTPAPTNDIAADVRLGAGVDDSDRVTIIWADNAIKKQWLQVTVLATANTGLGEADVFYFGNMPGDATGDGVTNGFDLLRVRQNYLMPPGVGRDDTADVTMDGNVNGFDLLAVRQNYLQGVPMILAPAAASAGMVAPAGVVMEPFEATAAAPVSTQIAPAIEQVRVETISAASETATIIRVVFNRSVSVAPAALEITAASGLQLDLSTSVYRYEPVTRTASWTIPSLAEGYYEGVIRASAVTSENGSPTRNYGFHFRLLDGTIEYLQQDINGDGVVDLLDLIAV